jgi:hypothetical protein
MLRHGTLRRVARWMAVGAVIVVVVAALLIAVRQWGRTEDISDNPLLVYLALLISPGDPAHRVFSFTGGFAKSRADLFSEETARERAA